MTDYTLGHSADELDRLQRQAGLLRGITESIWRAAGLTRGMRVLDVGCGAGDTSLLAADIVGPEGQVIGQDRAAEAIALARTRAGDRPQLSFLVGEMGELPAGAAPYDAVIGRYVLIHQSDVVKALRSLRPLVRPGGLLAFHELELHVQTHADPAAALVQQVRGWIGRAFYLSGTQMHGVTRLPQWFHEAGYGWPEMRIHTLAAAGTDGFAPGYLTQTLRTLAPVLERAGVVSIAELGLDTLEARLRAACSDGSVLLSQVNAGAWVRV